MQEKQRYSTDIFDIDAIASVSKLSLCEKEKQSFLRDICDMANYTYSSLSSESVDDALAVCALPPKKLDELREDRISVKKDASLLQNAPDLSGEYVRVPKTVGGEEEQK